MKTSDTVREKLVRIAERAATLDERLKGIVWPVPEETDKELVPFRIQKWKTVLGGGDDLFQARLSLDGIDPDAVTQILGAVRLPDPENPPVWVDTLEDLILTTKFIPCSERSNRRPFDELLLCYARRATIHLKQINNPFRLLTEKAFESLENSLLFELSRICSRALALELNVARLLGRLAGSTPRERYTDFVRKTATPEGMLSFFSEYPVAGRLVAGSVIQWIDSNNEFLTRLHNDLPEMVAFFDEGRPSGKVSVIRDRISDPHNGGRATKQLTFESGLKLFYKTKDLTLDHAFQDLIEWLNYHGRHDGPADFPSLRTFRVLNRKSHGWVESLEPAPCQDMQEIHRYFRRAGMLLSLLHVLGATDCHYENLIACGEHPVLIDLETLLEVHPAPPKDRPQNAEELAIDSGRLSLFYTGMIPRLIFADAGVKGADLSGLTGGKDQQFPYRVPEWMETETDRMRLEFRFRSVPASPSRAMLDNSQVSASYFHDRIEQGFREMYLLLLKWKGELLESGPLESLCSGSVRYLNRATAEYAMILQKSLDPSFLRNGIDRSIHLDLLFRNLFLQEKESCLKLVIAERQALERLDVPYFTAGGKEGILTTDRRETVEGVSITPAEERLLLRIGRINEEEMSKQALLLQASWYTRDRTFGEDTKQQMSTTLLTKYQLIRAAVSIGEQLRKASIQSSDGTVTWIGAEYVPHLNQFGIMPVGSFIYSGKSGIALFLAALERFVPGQGYGELALGAIRTIQRTFRPERAQLQARSMWLGALSGIGSICWALLQIGEMLQESKLIDDALRIGALITPDLIAKDRYLDIVAGSAGAILVLLALDPYERKGFFRNRAEECAKHLLGQSVQPANGHRAWQTLRGEMLTGFSHGASGYAYALSRLYAITGKDEYRKASLEALAYEKSLFSPDDQNWPDLRIDAQGTTDRKFMTGWCHGAPGITLARFGCLDKFDSMEIREEIQVGLEKTMLTQIKPQDDTCCGNFSRIETLLIASRYLKRPDLYTAALARASTIVYRAKDQGRFQIEPNIDSTAVNPGFMKGIAGIGYGLLRLADRQSFLPTPLFMDQISG